MMGETDPVSLSSLAFRGSADSQIQGVQLNFPDPLSTAKPKLKGSNDFFFKGSEVLNVCPRDEEDFLVFFVIICSFQVFLY